MDPITHPMHPRMTALWPLPFYTKKRVDNFSKIQKELQEAYTHYEPEDFWDAHHVTDRKFSTNVLEECNCKYFIEELDYSIKEYCKYLNFYSNYKIIESWFATFNPNEFAHIHYHLPADMSGAYYLRTNGEDGDIFFEDPNPLMNTSKLFKSEQYRLSPVEGGLMLFPSWLKHGVNRNKTNNIRISLSFNIIFEKDNLLTSI